MKIQSQDILSETPDGDAIVAVVTLVLPPGELDPLLAAYDPGSATSPPVADCRPLVRAILDAVLASRNPL